MSANLTIEIIQINFINAGTDARPDNLSVMPFLFFAMNFALRYALLTHYCLGDKNEKNEMGGAFSTYGGEEMCIQGLGGET